MRAMVMQRTGGPEVLKLSELPRPEISDGRQVLVRVHAAGVNPIDTKLRRRGLYFGQPPAVLGCDGAGVVAAVGDAVGEVRPGDAVFYCYGGLGQPFGNYADYTLVDAAALCAIPAGLEMATAAAAPLVLITAWEALFDRARLHEGMKVLIHGGGGGVGHVAIQLARVAGCAVATTVGSAEKAAWMAELGADLVVRYDREDVVARVRDWSGGEGVDVALDTVGGEAFHQAAALVRPYGDLVTLLQLPADADLKGLRLRNVRISQELMLTPMVLGLEEGLRHQAAILEQCGQLMEQRRLVVRVSELLPLEQAAHAHRTIEQGHATGKLVLDLVGEGAG
ncbi:MAG: alcohol dehydrogenase [Zetaproteobacteria bacterium]|nr:MAG: alcohol dehydrogenase [Zetaproteobacteria bacterium]